MFRQMRQCHEVEIWTRYRQCQFWGYLLLLLWAVSTELMLDPDSPPFSNSLIYNAVTLLPVFIGGHFGIKVARRRWQVDKAHRALSFLKVSILMLITACAITFAQVFSYIYLYPKLYSDNLTSWEEKVAFFTSGSGFFQLYIIALFWTFIWSITYHWYINRRENKRLHRQIVSHSLQSLQYRMNPCALSRALRVIQAEIIQNKEHAADLVTDLSSLLRYNLTAGQRTHVSLQEEWRFLLIFIKLHNLSIIDKKTLIMREKGLTEVGELGIPSCLLQDIAQALISYFGRDLEELQWCFLKQPDELLISFEANMNKAVTVEQLSASLQTVQYQLSQQFPSHNKSHIRYQAMTPSVIINLPVKEI